jgi:spermidine synthase
MLREGGFLTYDLGQPRSVSALYLQGDSNDVYFVAGSLDGSAGSFERVGVFENVVDRGHGLRNRAVRIESKSVRFLRVSPGRGDGSFSISEFAVYCTAPSPFPPALRSVGIAPPPPPENAPTAAALEQPSGKNRTILAVVAAVLVALLLAPVLNKRNQGQQKLGKGKKSKPAKAQTAAAELSTHDQLMVLFVASGCAALIYEVVWLHLMRLVIGASALSVGIVLASFMGGMFLGSLLFARFVAPEKNPLKVYAYLEIGIGLCGILMPLVLPAVRSVYIGLFGYGAMGIALRALIAGLMLLPPTALMGATLPAIARRYSHGRVGMSGLASLYAANTIGAVLGSLLAAFYLLADWDVWVATFCAAALNLGVGAYAIRLSRTTPHTEKPAAPARPAGANARRADIVYLAAGLSGLTALGAQVVWTRILTLLFGATVYAFAIILAVFLAGLGLGSAAAAYLVRRGVKPVSGFAWSQLALIPALLVGGYILVEVLPYASPPASTPIRALHALHVLRALAVILPGAVLWGMSFPFALAAAGRGSADTGQSSGYAYAANTVGAIIGALAVSFWLIPTYGTKVASQVLVAGAGISAAVLFFGIARAEKLEAEKANSPAAAHPLLALGAGIVGALMLPGLSPVFLAHGRYIWWIEAGDQYPYVSEGAASTVAVHIAPNGYRNFHVSGRVEATNNPNDLRTERLIGHLSGLLHPKPESVLVVGLGGGVSAGALTLYPEIKRIVICEIEPRVTGATKQFARENYSVLSNPKVEVVFDDARHFLATTREQFDIITSDPIHPWVRGNSMLFSREYYDIVKSKLKPGGIATQWVPLYETSEKAIQIQMRTFIDAFPNGTVWNTAAGGGGYDVVLAGGVEPMKIDVAAIQRRMDSSPQLNESLREVRITSALDLVATYGTRGSEMKKWLADTPANHDFSLKLEYISGLALNVKAADPIYTNMTADRVYPEDMLLAPETMRNELKARLGVDAPARPR